MNLIEYDIPNDVAWLDDNKMIPPDPSWFDYQSEKRIEDEGSLPTSRIRIKIVGIGAFGCHIVRYIMKHRRSLCSSRAPSNTCYPYVEPIQFYYYDNLAAFCMSRSTVKIGFSAEGNRSRMATDILLKTDLLILVSDFHGQGEAKMFLDLSKDLREQDLTTLLFLRFPPEVNHFDTCAVVRIPSASVFSPEEYVFRSVECVVTPFTYPSYVCVDFADVRSILDQGGYGVVGSGDSLDASDKMLQALYYSSIAPGILREAKSLVLTLMGPPDISMDEFESVSGVICKSVNPEAHVVSAMAFNNFDHYRVTALAFLPQTMELRKRRHV